jgi:hypothetical protein
MRNLLKVFSRNPIESGLFAVVVVLVLVLVFISAALARKNTPNAPTPTPTATATQPAESTETSTPAPQIIETPTATPTLRITKIPTATLTPQITETPTATPTAVTPTPSQDAKIDPGICLTDKNKVHIDGDFTNSLITSRYSDFPKFSDWCSSGINNFLTSKSPGATVSIDMPSTAKTIFLMATINGNLGDHGDVAKITYKYNDGAELPEVFVKPAQNIAWDYNQDNSLLPKQDAAYRVWSGMSEDLTHGAQVLVLVLNPPNPPNLNSHLTAVKITHLDSPIYFDLYGIVTSDYYFSDIQKLFQEHKNNNRYMKPLCLQDSLSTPHVTSTIDIGIGYYSRSRDYKNVVNIDREYYTTETEQCDDPKNTYFVADLPDELLPHDDGKPPIRIPFLLGPKVYESRPFERRAPEDYSTKPTITIILTNTQKIDGVYLSISAMNLCNRRTSFQHKIGEVQIFDSSDGVPVEVVPLEVGKNIRQGRSGSDFNKTICNVSNDIGKPLDARRLGNALPYVGIPLASQMTAETNMKSVALWADVIFIDLKGKGKGNGRFTKIVLTDETKPVPREQTEDHNGDTVDFNDPYLVLYGVTIQTAQ